MRKINCHSIYHSAISLLILMSFFIPTLSVKADLAPKPSMDFYFQYRKNDISAISGKLLLCTNKDCDTFVEYVGSFNCKANHCSVWSSIPREQFTDNHKIVITFSDGVRESNIFTKKGYHAQYDVMVEQDYLFVEERFKIDTFFNPLVIFLFAIALFFTAFVETTVASFFVWRLKIQKSFLFWIVLANVISLPVIWFVLTKIPNLNETTFTRIAEPSAIIIEGLFLTLIGRRYKIAIKFAFLLSIVMNLASFLIGWLLVYKLTYP